VRVWSGYGRAVRQAVNHTAMIVFTALGSVDSACARKGWQMATYRSTVNAVIVRIEADDVISVRNVLKRQYG
jgi:precorrin-6B methylase 1